MALDGSMKSPLDKLYEVNWLLPMFIFLVGLVGVAMIYSATGGVWGRGALQHLTRLCVGLVFMLIVAMIDIRVWYTLAYPGYVLALLLLLGVELFGVSVNGSQRWLDLIVMRVQPSEFMKLAIVLALARFYHDLPTRKVSSLGGMLVAAAIIGVPTVLILKQPDLGTTLLLMATGGSLVFLAGLNWRIVVTAIVGIIVSIPLILKYGLKDYQRERVLTFLDPSRDPSGASYHIIQSKIALGSGGVSGKGFTHGTQAALNYVPENRTDFIFTIIGEEFGLIGGLATMLLYFIILVMCFLLASQCRHMFSKLVIFGLSITFSLYVFINLAMVMGIAPVVGVPLPLISYGGTVMMTVMAGFGIVLSAHIHRDIELPRGSGELF